MSRFCPSIIEDCEVLLRVGQTRAVLSCLAELSAIPKAYRAQVASLYRRAGDAEAGLALFPKQGLSETDHIEYCFCLKEIGAVSEAEIRLDQFCKRPSKEAWMCRIHIFFAQWRHEDGLIAVEQYLACELSDYERQIGLLNKTSSLIALQRYEDAICTVENIIEVSSSRSWTRILVSAYELRAQVELHQGRLDRAETDLERASRFAEELGKENLFVQKWRAILQARRERSLEPIQKVRRAAREMGHWETLRALDFESLSICFSQDTFERLYFGSMHGSYRRQVRDLPRSSKLQKSLPSSYRVGSPESPVLSLQNGIWNGRQVLKIGSKTHRLIEALLCDFYRPLRIGDIFSQVFPGEFFCQRTSRHRVHTLVYRVRQWAETNELPIQILEDSGCYHLQVGAGIAIEKYDHDMLNRESYHLSCLIKKFAGLEFSAREAGDVLQLSRASTYRVLKNAVENGQLVKSGVRHHTRYRGA